MDVDSIGLFLFGYCALVLPFAARAFAAPYLNVFQKIPQAHAEGEMPPVHSSYYSNSEVEAVEHQRIHKEMMEHADGQPFYSNTFRGIRRHYYDVYYKKVVRKRRRLAEKAADQERKLKAARKLEIESKRVNNLSLESRIHHNRTKSKVGK